MGRAKDKLFTAKPRYPKTIAQLIDQGALLEIDIEYGKCRSEDQSTEDILSHAALLATLRKGHLCTQKQTVDAQLAPFIQEGKELPKYTKYLQTIATQIDRLLAQEPLVCSSYENPKLTKEQADAVACALSHPLLLLTGGPGTGKTHTAASIVAAMQTKTLLTAPTGKATSHLQSSVGDSIACATLHSLLKIKTPLDYLKEPEQLDAQLVIVDEATMIDPPLFAKLLASIGPNTHLVLMGDPNQLPSVEGGSIFADLLDSKKIPTCRLTQCIRSDRLEIVQLGQAILESRAGDIRTVDFGFGTKKTEEILFAIWSRVKTADFSTFRILSTLRQGPLGVDALNAYLFEKFSRVRDSHPILITRNDAHTQLSNGEVGFLKNGVAYFSGERTFEQHLLPAYEYAYCLSVHKSQGSEYEEILLLVPEGSDVFGREVLYTAVTRAKKKIDIDGSLEEIQAALSTSSRRASNLCALLKNKVQLIFES